MKPLAALSALFRQRGGNPPSPMSQNLPIDLKEVASPKAHNLALKVREIEADTKAYSKATDEVFKLRAGFSTEIVRLRNDLQSKPSVETARELMKVASDASAFDGAHIRLLSLDEFNKQVLPKLHPDLKEVARDLCQEVVNTLHHLRLESEADDAKAAQALGIEKVVSSRTGSIAWIIDECAMKATWSAASVLAGKILDGANEATRVPVVIK